MKQTQITRPSSPSDTEVIEDLPTAEAVDFTEVDTLLADIEDTLGEGDALSDGLLLDAVRREAPAKVKAGTAIPTVRAWTMGGSVD